MKNFRPTAIPLIACDPYFSVWSFHDKLNGDATRHWTGASNSMCGVLSIDGEPYRFMGVAAIDGCGYGQFSYLPNGKALKQTSVTVNPTTTVYTFAHKVCNLTVTFVTPLLMDRLEVMTRPVSYVFYEITPLEEGHTFEFYFDASAQLAGDLKGQFFSGGEKPGHAWIGNKEQSVLNRCEDDIRIDWGYLHLVHPNARVGNFNRRRAFFKKRYFEAGFHPAGLETIKPYKIPVLYTVSDKLSDVIVLAYDDIKSIQYYHQPINGI